MPTETDLGSNFLKYSPKRKVENVRQMTPQTGSETHEWSEFLMDDYNNKIININNVPNEILQFVKQK